MVTPPHFFLKLCGHGYSIKHAKDTLQKHRLFSDSYQNSRFALRVRFVAHQIASNSFKFPSGSND